MVDDLFSVTGKHIVITGATGLVGSEISKSLAARGARLTLVGSKISRLIALASELDASEKNFHSVYELDINCKEDVKKFTSETTKNDIARVLIHCAMARPGQSNHGNYEISFDDSILGNVISSFILWDAFSKHMATNGGGSLIYINSIYGIRAPDFNIYEGLSMGTEPDYMFIKSGMIGLTKYYASKYGKAGVRSNSIILGGVTNQQQVLFQDRYIQKTSLNRMATPADVIGAIVYLASDASCYVSGSEIRVEGGYLCK